MNVLIAFPFAYPGGSAAANRLQNMACGLRAAGAEVCVVALAKPDQIRDSCDWFEDPRCVPYTLAYGTSRPQNYIGRASRFFALLRQFAEKTKQAVQDRAIDVVILYGHSWYKFTRIVTDCHRQAVPVLMDCTEWHDFSIEMVLDDGMWLDQEMFIYRLFPRLQGLIAISRLWEEYARLHRKPVIRIPAFGDTEIPQIPRTGESSGKRFTVVYLGAMVERELPQTMLQGVRLAVDRGYDIHMISVGRAEKTPAGRRAIASCQADPTLQSRVTFTGWVSDEEVRQYLAKADAFVLLRPDCREVRAAFPTRLPEYLHAGRPVILSAVGDMPVYFRHRENAWLLPPGDSPEALADAIVHLADHPEEARSIGQAGRETLLRDFSYLTQGRRLRAFLDDVCGHMVKTKKEKFRVE